MYAVIKAGGKQQKVKPGDVIEVDHMGDPGETVTFRPILVVDDDGKTHVGKEAEKALVTAQPLGDKKGDKIKVFRYRPKTGYAKRGGHRQLLTLLEVTDVSLGGRRTPSKRAAKPTGAAEPEPQAEAEEPAAGSEETAADAAGASAGES